MINIPRTDNINGNALTRRSRRDIDPVDSIFTSREEKVRERCRSLGRNPKLIREIEYNREVAKSLDTYDMLDSLGY